MHDNLGTEKFLDTAGALAEMTLVFYRNLIQTGSTTDEARVLTQALICGMLFGKGKGEEIA